MFTYIDPTVSTRLVAQRRLVRFDERGRDLDFTAPVPATGRAFDMLGPIPLPFAGGGTEPAHAARWYAVVRHTERESAHELARSLREHGDARDFSRLVSYMAVNSALVFGDPSAMDEPLVRVHSNCLTGDVFGSRRCDCGPQLAQAMERLGQEQGILVYMAGHEGRGIGLWAKAATYLLQDAGENTYQANRSLGLPDDSRDFSDAAAILLRLLGGEARPLRLLTNNPQKAAALREHGFPRVTMEPHVAGVGEHNQRYLEAKRDWGHVFGEHGLGAETPDESGADGKAADGRKE